MTELTDYAKNNPRTVSLFCCIVAISCCAGFVWGDSSGLALPLVPFLIASLLAILGPLTFLTHFEPQQKRRIIHAFALLYFPLCFLAFLILTNSQPAMVAFKNTPFRFMFTGVLFWNALWSVLLYYTRRLITRIVIVFWVAIPWIWLVFVAVLQSIPICTFGCP